MAVQEYDGDSSGGGSVRFATLRSERVAKLLGEVHRAEAALLAELAPWAADGDWALDGARSAVAWLRGWQHLAPGRAAQLLSAAKTSARLPVLAVAHAAGEVSLDHVRAIGSAHRAHDTAAVTDRVDTQLADSADLLVDAARRLDPLATAKVVAHWRAHAVPDAVEVDEARLRDRRGLYLSETIDGLGVLNATLDPESLAFVTAALDAYTDVAPDEPGATRTASQRRLDALVDACRSAITEPGEQRPRHPIPTLLEAGVAADGQVRFEYTGGNPLGEASFRRLLCDTTISLLTSRGHEILDLGRDLRTPTTAQRKALNRRDRRCRFPGCRRVARHCDAHHVDWFEHGGRTDLANLVLLCRYHHRLFHHHDYTAVYDPTANTLTVTTPDSRTLVDHPDPPPLGPPRPPPPPRERQDE